MKSDATEYDVIVLGAGVSGLSSAYFLAREGKSVCVVEDYDHAGGNHISASISDYTFDIGSIFFWPENPQFKMFEGSQRDFVPVRLTFARLTPQGDVQPYPLSVGAELLARPATLARTAVSLAWSRLTRSRPANVEDYAVYHVGRHLYERSGLKNYIRRFYGVDPKDVDLIFSPRMNLEHWTSLRRLLGRLPALLRRRGGGLAGVAPSNAIARPQVGFGAHYDRIVEVLRASGVDVILAAGVEAIAGEAGRFTISTGKGALVGRRLLNTFPLKKIHALLGHDGEVELESTQLCTLWCSFAGRRGFDSVVLYNFHAAGLWKRLTMHSDYYGRRGGREYFSVEITSRTGAHDPQALFQDFAAQTRSNRLLDGDLRLEGHRVLDYAYPLFDLEADARRTQWVRALADQGVETIGRQGLFDYVAHSSIAIEAVRERYGGDIAWTPYQGPPPPSSSPVAPPAPPSSGPTRAPAVAADAG